ncbi:Chitin deacetylase, partial [Leucoagaricus sp. SymC.cos]
GPLTFVREEIIRILKENGAVGTFFFIGCINEPSNAARVKAAYDAGHQVASHTWSHKDLATLPQDEKAIKDITGVTPAFMRPPYGSYNDDVLEVAAKIGQDVALWNVDSGDSVGVAPGESQSRYDQAIQQKLPILALNHETHVYRNDVLPSVLKKLKDAGYRLVSVAECVGKEPYLKDAPALPSVSHSSR